MVVVKGSLYSKTPSKNCSVGAIYCMIPTMVSGIRRAAEANIRKDQYVAGSWEGSSYEGKLYGIPYVMNAYRKEALKIIDAK